HKGDSGCIVEKDSSIQSVVLKPKWDDGLSLSRPSESKTPSTSSSTSSSASKEEEEEEEKRKEEEDLRKEVEALKQKLKLEEEKRKREELKTARLMRKVDHRVIFDLVDKIKKSPDSESTSKLYHEHRDEILSVFLAFQSKSEIEEHKREIVLCVQCLRWFVRHYISGNDIFLPIPDLNDLIDTFIDHLSRCEKVLEGDVDEEYCSICINYSGLVHDKWDSFLPNISPTFQRILERGSKEKLGGDVAQCLLITLSNISNSPSSSTRSSILTLIKPYIRDWLRIYKDDTWPLFHPVLDVVKREFVGDKIVQDDHEWVLLFFSNLCCDPSHAVEVYDNVKDLLDMWFTVMKKEGHKRGIKYWSKLISMFSTVPSLVPFISPKYDTNMKWCNNNGGWDDDYTRYLSNRYPYLKWSELVVTINKCPDSASKYRLYHEHRDEILSVFLAFQSKSEIEEHKREIVLCAQCLRWFVRHVISGNDIYLPIPDLNDLIDTFIGHLSRCEEVLEGDVDEEY
ncbi:hypothetical protein ADUPG1_012273, partial [Aduncisulcus paluster]